MAPWFPLALAALAVWRVTHLLAYEDGPADLLVRLRRRLGASFAGRLMDCFYCLSLWVAAPAAVWVGRGAAEVAMAWLAVSGAACLLERMAREPVVIQPVQKGDSHELLRTEPELAAEPASLRHPDGR